MNLPALISVIIPSYQQAAYLEATLESVYAQVGARWEIIVIDGGSTDGSVELLRQHAPKLAHWESTPDRGQSHAFNKGLARARGEAWLLLNSDDLLLPGALAALAAPLVDPQCSWSCGSAEIWNEHTGATGQIIPRHPVDQLDLLCPWRRRDNPIFPFTGACLLRRSLLEQVGWIDESLHYSMDMEYYTRIILQTGRAPAVLSGGPLARWRWHDASKTSQVGRHFGFLADEIRIARRYAHHLTPGDRRTLRRDLRDQRRWMAVGRARHRGAKNRRRHLVQLLLELARNPTLVIFRPWLGACRGSAQGTGGSNAS